MDQGLAERAKEVYSSAKPKLTRIVVTFPHYTAHDITHSLKTLEICEWLASHEIINLLNAPVICTDFINHSS
jgi:hypothetical protein